MAQRAAPRYNPAVPDTPNALRRRPRQVARGMCGVFGIFGTSDAAALTALGLHALQHRGQEAAGIVTFDGGQFHDHRAPGPGRRQSSARSAVIGAAARRLGDRPQPLCHHRRRRPRNVQPLFADFEFGGLAIAHNGNLTNAYILRQELVRQGCLFQSTTDTEVIIHLIAPLATMATVVDRLIDALQQVEGAYSLVLLTNENADRRARSARRAAAGAGQARRMPRSWPPRPARSTSSAPDSCATSSPARWSSSTTRASQLDQALRRSSSTRFCIFEYIYFARPDSRRRRPSASTRCASASARSWREESPVAGRRRRAGARFRRAGGDRLRRRQPACPSSSASSAITMSAAPSSSRPTTSAISA